MNFNNNHIQLGANGTVQMASLEPCSSLFFARSSTRRADFVVALCLGLNAIVMPISVNQQIFGIQGLNYPSESGHWVRAFRLRGNFEGENRPPSRLPNSFFLATSPTMPRLL